MQKTYVTLAEETLSQIAHDGWQDGLWGFSPMNPYKSGSDESETYQEGFARGSKARIERMAQRRFEGL